MNKAVIEKFLTLYGTKVSDNETAAYVELMMDNHKCIDYKGVEYYIPENSVLYGEVEENIYDHIVGKYQI